jgi:prevent-host-death family protein
VRIDAKAVMGQECNVRIGYGACILRGVSVGDNAILGTYAVVTKNVPAERHRRRHTCAFDQDARGAANAALGLIQSRAAPRTFQTRCHHLPNLLLWHLMTTTAKDNIWTDVHPLGVAEAKRRFSELIDRVRSGEHFVVSRRGRPAMVLSPPSGEALRAAVTDKPIGLAAVAGALADWDDLEETVEEIYAARRGSRDRPVPDLD